MSTTIEAPATTADLMTRLAGGDGSITATDLLAAEDAERQAVAEATVAAARSAAAAERDRERRIAELVAGLPAALDPAPVDKARAAMERAIAAYVAAEAERDAALAAAVADLEALGPLPRGVHVHDGHRGSVTVGPATWRRGDYETGIVRAAVSAIKARHPRAMISLRA